MDIVVIGLGVFLGFLTQTMIGLFATLIALPFLLSVFTPQEAISFISIFLLLFSAILVPLEWKHIDRNIVRELAFTVIVGLFLGIFILRYANPHLLKKLIGLYLMLYVINVYTSTFKIDIKKKTGWLYGFCSGIFSGLFNAGGSLIAAYVAHKKVSAQVTKATIIGVLALVNAVRIPILWYNGLFTADLLVRAIPVIPFFLGAILIGKVLSRRINDRIFRNILMVFIFISGASLLIG